MPDAEKRRQKSTFRRGLMQAGVVATVIISLVGGSVYWYFDSYVWTNIAYYNSHTKRFGIMEGIGKLTVEQAQNRAVSYKFFRQSRKNPVYKVQAVKGTSELVSDTSGVKTIQKVQAVKRTSDNLGAKTIPKIDELTTHHDVNTYLRMEPDV